MTSDPTQFDFEIPARPEYLSLVRSLVVEAAEMDASLSRERIEDFKVAVSEATTNAIEAHARACRDDSIRIRCTLFDDRLEFHITDRGYGFYPDQIQVLPEPDDPSRLNFERGLGIYLMRVLSDKVEIQSGSDGTEVSLAIDLPANNSNS
ncbi:MAG: ATP-binding protein [Acidimicrobiia bacterium]|nr:ATP-binding protein [Acidimicrobiia bacterium]MYG72710.1 ATP-binding protein [Acidimicrobiia bacterium]MYH95123.1 ATP-binding protein [Acidimicrobiia bacterium]MYL10290.1 ATP-binding protein [Acidimicrobiia bacterium]